MSRATRLARAGALSGSAALVLTLASFVAGCASSEWKPKPPSGVTYEYDSQGFTQHGVTAFGGVMPSAGIAYGGAFSFHSKSGVVNERSRDPLGESTPIDGMHFNEHLAGRGTPVDAAAPSPAPGP